MQHPFPNALAVAAIALALVACAAGDSSERGAANSPAPLDVTLPSALHQEADGARGQVAASREHVDDGPLTASELLLFKAEVSNEVSCSQSFESSSEQTSYTLALTPPNMATLSATVSYRETSGPSLSQFRQGHQGFSNTGSDLGYEWRGHAQWTKDRLAISFDGTTTCTAPRATGAAPLCSTPTLNGFTCERSNVAVRPALGARVHPGSHDANDEATTSTRVLKCTPPPPIGKLEIRPEEQVGLLFHDGPGLRFSVAHGGLMSFNREQKPSVRFAE